MPTGSVLKAVSPRRVRCATCSGLFGWGPDYGTGGYVTTLSLNKTEALATLAQMKADLYVPVVAAPFTDGLPLCPPPTFSASCLFSSAA